MDLEATTVYGKRHRITGALDRLSSIKPLWDLLKHLPDAEWKKLQIRQQCIWANWFKCGATSWRSTRNPNQRPFGTSIKVFTLVGWSVEVPGFYDHYGFWVSFLDTTDGILRSLAEDAWGQYLAHEVTNRKDFSDCSPLISWLLDVYSEDWISRSESFCKLHKMAPFWMPSRRASSTWQRSANAADAEWTTLTSTGAFIA